MKTTKRKAAPAAINTPEPEPTLPERILDVADQLLKRAAATGPDLELGGLGLTLAMVANDAEQQLAALTLQRDLAQPSPTPWAYEQACKALRKHHDRATTAEQRLVAVRALHHPWDGADPACCAHCQDGQGTPLPYPCPTIQALDGKATSVLTVQEPLTTEQAEALRAHWTEHFAEHARNGTISPYSPTRVAEDIEQAAPRTETP